MSSRKTTGDPFDLVPVAITAIDNQRTTCFPQIAHYTPAFVSAHRRRSLLTPVVRSSSKSQDWITHRPAALCSCHSLNPLHASVLKQGPSSSPDFSAVIPPAEPVVTNIDVVTGSRMNGRVATVEGLPRTMASFYFTGFSTLINRSAPFRRSLISTPGHHPRIPRNQSQHECRHILKNSTVTNSTDRRISSHEANRGLALPLFVFFCFSLATARQSLPS